MGFVEDGGKCGVDCGEDFGGMVGECEFIFFVKEGVWNDC